MDTSSGVQINYNITEIIDKKTNQYIHVKELGDNVEGLIPSFKAVF